MNQLSEREPQPDLHLSIRRGGRGDCVWPAAADHASLVLLIGRVPGAPQLPGAGQMLPRRVSRLSLLKRANSLSRSLKL